VGFPRLPDWLIYATVVVAILVVSMARRENADAPPPPPPPNAEEGALLGPQAPFDPMRVVQAPGGALAPVSGTAFAVAGQGRWLTAAHVVEDCKKAAILLGGGHAIPADVRRFPKGDVALLVSAGAPTALPIAPARSLREGQRAYATGYPQGAPGEVAVRLLGRERLRLKPWRGAPSETVLAWAEVGRTEGLKGSLSGLSGAPMLDGQGRVVGVTIAERPRRGRIYTTAPEGVSPALKTMAPAQEPAIGEVITVDNYGRVADSFRRDLRVAQVVCL
jgi:S1-C subfamily serine protease